MGFSIFKKLKSSLFPRSQMPTQEEVKEMSSSPEMVDIEMVTQEISKIVNQWMILTKEKYFDTERQTISTLNKLKGFLLITLRKYIYDTTPHLRDVGVYITESASDNSEIKKVYMICVNVYTNQGYASTVIKNLLVFRDGSCKFS